jgi:26S proteasome regulatory subunit N12
LDFIFAVHLGSVTMGDSASPQHRTNNIDDKTLLQSNSTIIMSSQSLEALLQQLQSLVDAGNVQEGKKVLSHIKIAILSAPPGSETLAATALELGVLLSVADESTGGDLTSLSRHMALLLPYYGSSGPNVITSSTPRKAHVLGLHLMHLLVEHRLAEFHSLLEEYVTDEGLSSSPFISFPVGLERQLMVGMYEEVLSGMIPDPSYQFFVDHLQQTVRDSIADGMEVSYQSLSLKDAASMMKFATIDELLQYIQDFRDDWIIEGDRLAFSPVNTTVQASDINAQEWIQQSLQYATEMERIV